MNKILYYHNSDAVHDFLTNVKSNIFIHGANCQATMNSGIARDVKNRIPELYQADLDFHMGRKAIDQLGKFSMVMYRDDNSPPHKMAFNLYTQFYYGTEKRHFNYGAFICALSSAIETAIVYKCVETNNEFDYTMNIVMPKIGCGLGGGDWNIVEEILQYTNFSNDVSIVFHVHIK